MAVDTRTVSLAAGVVQEFPATEVVHAAAQAGFNATGIWCDPARWTGACTDRVSRALRDTGLIALDLEVVWFRPGEVDSAHDGMIEIAMEIGARNLLCVSSEPDIARTRQRFEYTCRKAEGSDLRVVLEFLALTEIRSLPQALAVVRDVGHPAGGILVDTLHLLRTGGAALDLRDIDSALMPYLQVCDASASLRDSSPEGLMEDALYLRQLPGDGELPLRDILTEVDPLLPLSLEIRSRELIDRYPSDPLARATHVWQATRRFLGNN
jgi:sugar phosphate isomerase/epimerase